MEKVIVSGEGLKKLRRGTGIVYNKWIRGLGTLKTGAPVEVISDDGEVIACALLDSIGPVALRILFHGRCPYKDVESLLELKFENALSVRERTGMRSFRSYRLVNSDGDLLSGLIVDIYNEEVAVLQSSSLAIDANLDIITNIITKKLGVQNIFEKSTQRSRRDIGLEIRRRWLKGRKEKVIIDEVGARFVVDIVNGQKTGFYLDQKMNRIELRKFIGKGDRVLDIFSYTGGFGIHAVLKGAREVTFIEEDPNAIEILKQNIEINGVEKYKILRGSVWEVLPSVKDKFDVIVVDPPAFIQSSDESSIRRGKGAYRRAYSLALDLAEEDSIGFLSSCSYFLKRDEFLSLITSVMISRGFKCYRVLGGLRGASPDHVLRGEEYLEYLKAAFVYLRTCRKY